MMIVNSGFFFLSSARTSSPFILGMSTSRITKSGFNFKASSIPSLPSAPAPTMEKSGSDNSTVFKVLRTTEESSTMSTRIKGINYSTNKKMLIANT